jgi:hypothetical protein
MPDYGASLPVRLCNFGHPSVSTPGWRGGVSEPGAFWTSQRVFFQIARGCPVIPLRAASRAVDRVDFFARLGGRRRRFMRLLLRERAGENCLEGASQNQTHAANTNRGSAAARASLRAARDPSLAAERGARDNSRDDRDYGRAVRGRHRTRRSVPHRSLRCVPDSNSDLL